jgi:hypothetical protein
MANWPTSRYPSSAETYEQISEQWSAKVIEATKSNLVCVGAFDTTWKDQLKMGDVLHIPVGSSLTAGAVDVTSDYGGNMNTDWGSTAETLTIDKWYECPVQVDDGTAMQTQINDIVNRLGVRSAYEINKTVDTDVNGLFSSLTSTWAGSDGQSFTDDLCIALMEGLDESDVDRTDRRFIIDPSVIADMFKIDKFVNRDYGMTLSGEIGRTPYGDTILKTNNLTAATTGNYCAYSHMTAIGIAIQKIPGVTITPWPQRHSTVVNVDTIWGSDVLRSTFGAYFYSRKS